VTRWINDSCLVARVTHRMLVTIFPLVTLLMLIDVPSASSWVDLSISDVRDRDRPDGIHILDGSYVMNVGELQINITNHGLIGSQHTQVSTFSDAPSGQWPGGSGDEYLWGAGLWVGGILLGDQRVSTGQYAREFRPLQYVEDTIYEAKESRITRPRGHASATGYRLLDPRFDDDGDGLHDEDVLNGYDDDRDGRIDEDFGQMGDQMMVCTMYDNTELSQELYSDHVPLNLKVVQTCMAWENDDIDDCVAFNYVITNIGVQPIEKIYLGMFVDCDIGPRAVERPGLDDMAGCFEGYVRTAEGWYAPVSVAYMYDAAEENRIDGYFGLQIINHPTDIESFQAPHYIGIRSFQIFTANTSFIQGGDPSTDAERYDIMSRTRWDPNVEPGDENDYRFLVSCGPFRRLAHGASFNFDVAMVMAPSLDELIQRCAEVWRLYWGTSANVDGEYISGSGGAETKVCLEDFGDPNDPFNQVFMRSAKWWDISCLPDSGLGLSNPHIQISEMFVDTDGKRCAYVNADCCAECARHFGRECTKKNRLLLSHYCWNQPYCSGTLGREERVPWAFLGIEAPPSPGMRLWPTDHSVHVYWNDVSEYAADPHSGIVDFESYRVLRADNWERPLGSSLEYGPESRLWHTIAEYDLIDQYVTERWVTVGDSGFALLDTLDLGPNTGFDDILYRPICLEDPRFAELGPAMQEVVRNDPHNLFEQRPQLRDETGDVVPGLEGLLPWEGFPAVLDTFFWVTPREAIPAQGVIGKRAQRFYEHIDPGLHNGFVYFYSVVATDHVLDTSEEIPRILNYGLQGDPSNAYQHAVPGALAQTAAERERYGPNIYVYPNPVTRKSLADFQPMTPNSDDPTGVRITFTNLPRAHNKISVYTIDGDFVYTFEHNGLKGVGQASWNLVTRMGQQVVSGIYLYVVQSDDSRFDDFIGKFVVIR
jgi:hypothetical protein